jgi:hypothetical protein
MSDKLERIGAEALEEARAGAFGIAGCVWTATSLEIPADISYEGYEHVGWALGQLRDQSAWGLGEWLLAGEKLFPDRYSQAIEITGRSKGGLMNIVSVARRVPRRRRRNELTFGHHEVVAKLSPKEQIEWLALAVERKLTVEEFRGLFKQPQLSPNDVVRCSCCGSAITPGTVVRDQICATHGRTSIEKETAGIRYFRCGCLEAIEEQA